MQLQEEIRPQTLNPYEFEDDDEARFRSLLPHEVPERRGVLSVEPHQLQVRTGVLSCSPACDSAVATPHVRHSVVLQSCICTPAVSRSASFALSVNTTPSTQTHPQDLAVARSMLTDNLLEVVDDQLAQFGLDPRVQALSDKTYAACMVELERRRRCAGERGGRTVSRWHGATQERLTRMLLPGCMAEDCSCWYVACSLMLERVSPALAKRATDLRDGLLTHLELMKREMQKEQQAVAQKRLQEQVQKQAEEKAIAEAAAAAAAAAQAAEVAQMQQAAAAAAAAQPLGGAPAGNSAGLSSEILPPAPGSQPVRSGSASGLRTGSTSLVTPAVPAPASAAAPAAAAGVLASGLHSSGATSHVESPSVAVPAAKPQLPAFPARQPSIGRSAPSETNTDDLRSMLPGGGFR